MFPFDLSDPQFLAFYLMFAAVVVAAFYFGRRYYESGPLPTIDLTDPLLFACLRGGPKEVVRVATLGLIDRGLLKTPDETVAAETKPQVASTRIEREILHHFRSATDLDSILDRPAIERVAAEDYEGQLIQLRLVPDAEMLRLRAWLLVTALISLIGVGTIELMVAKAAGHRNVGSLFILMVLGAIVIVKLRGGYRTVLGDSCFSSIRGMLRKLRDRATTIKPGSGSRDLLWLTALFGAAALPTEAFPLVPTLWPKPRPTSLALGGGGDGGIGDGGGGCGGSGGDGSCG